jgi:hypothetical protein
MRGAVVGVMLTALVVAACGSSSSSDASACVKAGGQCLLGGNDCAKPLQGDDSCNSDHNPGGAFCCLDK